MCSGQTVSVLDWESGAGQVVEGLVGHGRDSEYDEKHMEF